MNKKNYDEQMWRKVIEGLYRHLWVDPLPGLIRLTDKSLKDCKPIIGKARLKEANPFLPWIKGLPKIHKPSQEMREIISAEGSLHTNWLKAKEFQNMPKLFPNSSVKSTQECIQKLLGVRKHWGWRDDDNFCVAALFASVLVNLLEVQMQHGKETLGLICATKSSLFLSAKPVGIP